MTTRDKSSLFLALPVNAGLAEQFAKANPALFSLFTQGGEAYLEPYYCGNQHYLGKRLSGTVEIKALEAVERNIYSLVERIVPGNSAEMPHLVLLSLPS